MVVIMKSRKTSCVTGMSLAITLWGRMAIITTLEPSSKLRTPTPSAYTSKALTDQLGNSLRG